MKRSATSTLSKTKKSKVAVAKRSYKRFYPVPRPLGQYSSGFPKQLAMTHRYSQHVQYTHVGPNANSQYANFERIAFWPMADLWGHQPLYFDQVAAIYQHYTVMKARMKVTIVPNTVDAYVSGILIDDDLTPAILTLDGMVEQPSAVFKTSQRDAEVVTIYKNWDVKSAFTTNPLANPNLQGDAAANPVETQAFIIFNRPVDQTVVSMQFNLYVSIEYDAVWTELRTMTMS